jgi:murein L,D-transpeptidase YafK
MAMRRLAMLALCAWAGALTACDGGDATRARRGTAADLAIDRVVVEKRARRLSLMHQGKVIRTYRIALGRHPEGHKLQEGDSRTPEGVYVIDARNPQSRFHLSLHISYPNAEDRLRAAERGVSPGGDIFIHGLPNGDGDAARAYSGRDWTDGCIAVTNAEIREIWSLVKDGTPIEIRP